MINSERAFSSAIVIRGDFGVGFGKIERHKGSYTYGIGPVSHGVMRRPELIHSLD